jgi:hypothetical protein
MKTRRGRPPKPKETVKTVHFGLKVTELEYALLTGIVASENVRLVKAGYEPMATTASMVRKMVKEEAKRRNLVDKELRPIQHDVQAEAQAEERDNVPLDVVLRGLRHPSSQAKRGRGARSS